jgi:Tol biopolymer transport system component
VGCSAPEIASESIGASTDALSVVSSPVVKDAQVVLSSVGGGGPNDNFGSSSTVVIGTIQITSRGFFGYALPSLPPAASVTKAELVIPAGQFLPGGTFTGSLSLVNDSTSWQESTITWNNQPAATPLGNQFTLTNANSGARLDVTSAVAQAMAAGKSEISFAILPVSSNVFIASKESDQGIATSLSIEFDVPGAGCFARDATTLVSVSSAGVQGNQNSTTPSLSADGRLVAFTSDATNLVAGDTNGASDIFLRDLSSGVTSRVSVSSAGAQGNAFSFSPRVSADGKIVAFASQASNLVAGDTNGFIDVFVRDLANAQTSRVSVSSAGVQGDQPSFGPVGLSADGRFVAFASASTNLVAGDTNLQSDVFVRDRTANQTTRVSVATGGVQANGSSADPSMSADGRFVAFVSTASNLVAGDTNAGQDVFVRDRTAGQTTRVSVATGGAQANGESFVPSISADGRFVAFSSFASNLVPNDTNIQQDVFVRDRTTGQTTRVSVGPGGAQGNGFSDFPTISADGRLVAFISDASNLVPDDNNGVVDLFVFDRTTGRMTRVDVSSTGQEANERVIITSAISADDRFVVFDSAATNLVPNDANGELADVFLRDLRPVASFSTFHLRNIPVAANPAGETLAPDGTSSSGFFPTRVLGTTPAVWYSDPLTGTFNNGFYLLNLWTNHPGAASIVSAQLGTSQADGSGFTAVAVSSAIDVNASGTGNHVTTFSLHVLAPLTLTNQRLVLKIALQSGVAPTMVYNGGVDFDTNLQTTGGCATPTVTAPVTFHLVGTDEQGVAPPGDHMRRTSTGASGFFPTALLDATLRRWYTEPINAAFPASRHTFVLWTNSPGAASTVDLEIARTDADGSNAVPLATASANVNASGTGNHTTTFGPLNVPAVTLAGQRLRVVLHGPASGARSTMVFNGGVDFDTRLTISP